MVATAANSTVASVVNPGPMMSTKHRLFGTSVAVAAGILAAGALGGCADSRIDLVQSGYLSVEPTITRALAHAPEVHEQDGGLVVSGKLESDEATRGGHIDVSVVAPDGTIAYDATVNYRKPAAHRRVGPRGRPLGARSSAGSYATYSVRFPGLPPRGSIVKVLHDPLPHAAPGGQ